MHIRTLVMFSNSFSLLSSLSSSSSLWSDKIVFFVSFFSFSSSFFPSFCFFGNRTFTHRRTYTDTDCGSKEKRRRRKKKKRRGKKGKKKDRGKKKQLTGRIEGKSFDIFIHSFRPFLGKGLFIVRSLTTKIPICLSTWSAWEVEWSGVKWNEKKKKWMSLASSQPPSSQPP